MADSPDLQPLSERAPTARGAPMPPAYLAALNPEQRAAVETTEGPVLVLAGAGTGKTRVLTTRIAHLLATRRAWPGQILAVTFTNKAAREMRERVAGMVGGVVEGMPWLGTFHSMSARILRRHAELAGLGSNFTIIDTDDQIRLLKQVIEAAGLDERRWPARQLGAIIDRAKNRALPPGKTTAAETGDFANGRAAALYAAYEERLKTLNAADFGDLLLHVIAIFTAHPEILKEYQDRFRYILVDEYQDTNVAQYLWLRLLAQGRRNLCCVGDDDQSIYGWRGAEVGNILRFEADFPGARVIRLERNYRSTQHILSAASGLIATNEGRLGKTLWAEENGDGERVVVRGVWDGQDEARLVGEEIEALGRRGEGLGDIAILVRASFQTREFEERFLTLGIPYQVLGGARFYDRMEIRDAIAYLRVIHQPDDDLAFERIVNRPRRGLGDATMQTLHRFARAEEISLARAARLIVETDELRPAARKSLGTVIAQFERWRGIFDELPHAEAAEIVLDESGYTEMWQNDKSIEAPGRLDNLRELITGMEEFENLEEFLEHVGLVSENDEAAEGERVSLMTLHGAKGLEFPVVFLPGWEEGLFPHQRSLDEEGLAGLEEERRLAYVGITRARRRVYITFAANRRVYNEWRSSIPSRFIDELPKETVDYDTDVGLYRAGGLAESLVTGPLEGERPRGGPGFRRAQEALRRSGGAAARLAESHRDLYATADPDVVSFNPGERVFHQKFGYGRIREISGNRLEVEFEKAGLKKVIDSFVTPAPKSDR